IDHQVSPKHSWAFRWLKETAPQFKQMDGSQETISSHNDDTDLAQTVVATLTSVLTDTTVNTLRYGGQYESTVHANPAWRALSSEFARCVPCGADAGLGQAKVSPVLDYETFDLQASRTMDYSLQRGHSLDDTFSVFIPEKAGRHDLKFGVRYTQTWLS